MRPVTPVHVGDGRGRLVHDVDFVIDRGTLYLIDVQRLWTQLGEDRLASWNDDEFRLSQLLWPEEYPEFASAAFPLAGHLDTRGGLLNQIRDPRGRPYLPGSSVKGAIRGALLRASGGPFDLSRLGTSRGWTGQPLERAIFGPNPNRDLLRALRIADGPPLGGAELRVFVVGIYSLRGDRLLPKGPDYRLNVVALPAGLDLELAASIDRYALDRAALGGQRAWLENLARYVGASSRALIDAERRFYAEVGQPGLATFYHHLARDATQLGPNEFFLPVGWGTGWLAKSIGPALRDAPGFDDLRQRFRLGRLEAPIFPKSRRLVETAADRPETPVGWIKVTVEEV